MSNVAGAPLRPLGKRPYRHDDRTLRLARYLDARVLPPAPTHVDYAAHETFPMHLNDKLGDCVVADGAHRVECWTALRGNPVTISDDEVLKAYETVGGYQPGHPETDQGTVMLDFLRYLRKTGLGGHRIGAFATIDLGDSAMVRDAIWLFGGVSVGLALPSAAQRMEHADGSIHWHVPGGGPHSAVHPENAPGSWGGHAVSVLGYDRYGLTFVTWGQVARMTWGFWRAYSDECWCDLSPDWVDGTRPAPNGVDIAALTADLAAVGSVRT